MVSLTVAALKKLFYQAERSDGDGDDAADRKAEVQIGLLRNIPIARFRMTLLPHSQTMARSRPLPP